MSYSIGAQAATKQEALDLIFTKLTEVCAQQPVHAADTAQAFAAAEAFVAIIPEPKENQDVYISLSGSVSWVSGPNQTFLVTVASVNVSANLVTK